MSNKNNRLLNLFEDYNTEHFNLKKIQCLIESIRDNGHCSNIEGIVKLILIINSHYGKSEETEVHLLKLLKYLMNKVMCHYSVAEVPNEIFELVFGSVICDTLNEALKGIFKTSLCKEIDKINLEDLLLKTENLEIQQNLSVAIVECYSLQKSRELFTDNLIPTLFKARNENARLILLDMAYKLKEHFPIDLKNKKQADILRCNIKNLFVPVIMDLQKQRNAVWQKLWIFLVQYLNKLLHNSKTVNPCLQIVESAFRSQNKEEKLKAFDCWKELINNYALDFNYLTNNRQINLLMIPLRVTTSKQEDVIVKKTDIWIHLLKMSKSIKCIEKFLQFSFGYGCNEKYELPGDIIKSLGVVSAHVLLEIIGHDSEKCDCISKNNILMEPIVNEEKFLIVEDVIIYSVLKCCIHLRYWVDVYTYNKVVQCLCTRLHVLIKRSGSISSLRKLVEGLTQFRKLFDNSEFVNNFIDTFVNILDNDNLEVLKEIFVFPLLKILLTLPISRELDTVLPLVQLGSNTENAEEFLKQNMNFITSIEMKNAKADLVFMLWIEIGKMCINTLSSVDKRDVFKPTIIQFLSWPLSYFHCYTEKDEVLNVWTELFQKSLQTEKTHLIREVHTILKNNPLIKSVILVFLLHLSKSSCVEVEEISTEMLRICNMVLLFPNLSLQDLNGAISIIYNCIDLLTKDQNVIIEEVCKSIQIILQKQQFFQGLKCLEKFIHKLPKSKYKIIDNMVSSHLEDLCIHDDNKINTVALKILSHINLKTTEKNLELVSPRSHKMLNMIEVDKTGTTLSWSNSSSALSTKNQRGVNSLKVQRKNKNRVAETKSSKDDDSYVLINSQVKVNKKKMNRHQRELFKKCRDDIPALYQDLSQSQLSDYNSQSCLSNDSSSIKKMNYDNKNELVVSGCTRNKTSNSENSLNYKENNVVDKKLNCFDEKNEEWDCSVESIFKIEPTTQNHCKTIDNKVVLENLKEKSDTHGNKEELNQVNMSLISETSKNDELNGTNIESETSAVENTVELDEGVLKNENQNLVFDAKREMRIRNELSRLKMDIVGGNSFLIEGPRRRRSKFSVKEKMQNADTNQEKNKDQQTENMNHEHLKESISQNKICGNVMKTERKKPNRTVDSLCTISKSKPKSKLLRSKVVTIKVNTKKESSKILNADDAHQHFTSTNLNLTNETDSSNILKIPSLENAQQATEEEKNLTKHSEELISFVSDNENITEDNQKFDGDKHLEAILEPTLEKKKDENIISLADEDSTKKENVITESTNTSSKKKNESDYEHNGMQNDISAIIRIDQFPNENAENKNGLESWPNKDYLIENENSIIKNVDKSNENEIDKTTEIMEMDNLKSSPEDIVECSQKKPYTGLKATYKHKISSLNSSNKKVNDTSNEESVINYLTVLTQQPKQEININIENNDVNSNNVCKTTELIDCEKDTASCDPNAPINYGFEINLNFGNNVVNESEKELCNLDTESITENERNVVPDVNITSSPETVDTPARNSEMLHSTLSISPIKCDNINTIHLAPEKHLEKLELKSSKNDDKCIQSIIENDTTFLKLPSPRSVKLFGLVTNSTPKNIFQNNISTESVCRKSSINVSSPKTDRIRKMMSNCEKQKFNTSMEDANDVPFLDYLTFTKDVPSPFAVPKIGILKRKRTDLNDEEMHSPKRKKVNFSDPLTTCKKLIQIDPMEEDCDGEETLIDFVTLPENKKKHAVKKNVKLIQKKKKRQCNGCDETIISDTVPKLDANVNFESKEVELNEINDGSPKKENGSNSNNLLNFDERVKEEISNNNFGNLETQTVETSGDIKTIVAKNHSNSSVNCQDDVEVINRSVLPVFNKTLMCVLRYTNISTVGDLYCQTSCGLPIQFPKEELAKSILKKRECKGHEFNNLKDAMSEYQKILRDHTISESSMVSIKNENEYKSSSAYNLNEDTVSAKAKVNNIKKMIDNLPINEEFENTIKELFFTLADKINKTLLEKFYQEYLNKHC